MQNQDLSTEPDSSVATNQNRANPARDQEIAELRQFVERAHDRIDELEAELEQRQSTDAGDSRDAAVLRCLERGDSVSLRQLQQLYRAQTDIRSSSTLKERIKTLTKRDCFEQTGQQRWKYLGGE